MFFFSSRRRHTRCLSDWSSDVCSSDLSYSGGRSSGSRRDQRPPSEYAHVKAARQRSSHPGGEGNRRSEERRVGKECRSRRSPDHEKKKSERQNSRHDETEEWR